MSCHHAAPAKTAMVTAPAYATNAVIHDLGAVALSYNLETCVKLGDGRSCTLLPRNSGGRDVELTVSIERRASDGKTIDLNVKQVPMKVGKPMEIALGDYQLSFTPNLP